MSPGTHMHIFRQCRTERKQNGEKPLNANTILYKNRMSVEVLLIYQCAQMLCCYYSCANDKNFPSSLSFYDCDLPNCWHVHISRPLIYHRTLRGLCASVLRAAAACLSLASCGSAAMQVWRRPRAKTWSRSRTRARASDCLPARHRGSET